MPAAPDRFRTTRTPPAGLIWMDDSLSFPETPLDELLSASS